MAFKRALPGMAALLLLAAAALAACGSPMTASERQAMDAESAEASSSESAAPLTAGILHTFACFTNASDIPITITWAGTNSNDGNGSIEPGKSRCGEGSTLKPWLTVPGASKPVNWEIYNRVIGNPAVETDANRGKWCAIGSRIGADPGASKSTTCWTAYFASMASLTVDLNEEGQKYAFDIIRRPDDQNALGGADTSGNKWKRFQITFRNR
jgi:hypothetical protein